MYLLKKKNKPITVILLISVISLILSGCNININRNNTADQGIADSSDESDNAGGGDSSDVTDNSGVTDSSDATDYSDENNWAYFGIGEDKAADLFLICPTVDLNDEYNMSLDDEKTKEKFTGALNMERGIYEDSTRMYAPYYKQAAMKVYDLDGDEREQYMQIAYDDISAAFDYYLENENKGRPIVLAGFSQGADMCYRLLEEYFGNDELYNRLVAVYAIGWPCTEEMVDRYPQIKPAASADDIGTVISFDCEAEDVTGTFICPEDVKACTINPLNWKTDSTVADRSLNDGACFTDYSGAIVSEEEELCGCYIDEERGVLKVTDISPKDYPAHLTLLPEGAYHIYDYQFFYRNLQENVANRINIFDGSKSDKAASGSRIYFAAPLFSEAEREYNLKIVNILESYGYEVFLPQRDGFLAPDLEGKTEEEKTKIIFQKDKEEILKSDIVFMLLDGRVPDEGACIELGIAYANGKRCYGFKSDARSIEADMDLNPMIAGCFTKIFYDLDGENLIRSLEDYLKHNRL